MRRRTLLASSAVPNQEKESKYLTITSLTDDCTIQYRRAYQYSYDEITWQAGTKNDIIPLSSGQKLYLKANSPSAGGLSEGMSTTGLFSLSGNCLSLLYGDNADINFSAPSDSFAYLFSGTGVVSVSKNFLPATVLNLSCYYNMFNGCTSLVEAPELPALTLASYCYDNMFRGCTSLVKAPELPALTLASGCYSAMFNGCTSLVEAPELPALTLASYCYYNMFINCASLVKAPELPALTLTDYCYNYMFSGCTSLVKAPELPALTLPNNCYNYMFNKCSSLNEITMLATKFGTNSLKSWVQGVASSGTFYKNNNLSYLKSGVDGIPTGWTVKSIRV